MDWKKSKATKNDKRQKWLGYKWNIYHFGDGNVKVMECYGFNKTTRTALRVL